MSDLFISYSRKDSKYAETLREHIQLLDPANDVFLDAYRLKVGVDWQQTIIQAIQQSKVFVLILSAHSAASDLVKKEVELIKKEEQRTGMRILFCIRIDNCSIPDHLARSQVLFATGNFTVDFFRLMDGINSKPSFYTIKHDIDASKDTGYYVTLFVDAPPRFLELIDMVEYRFDYEFEGSDDVYTVDTVERSKQAIKNKFAISFWINEPVLVFVVIYLKKLRQLSFEHRIPLYF